jgi:hypothetical protein
MKQQLIAVKVFAEVIRTELADISEWEAFGLIVEEVYGKSV